jgi:hypothetical protein
MRLVCSEGTRRQLAGSAVDPFISASSQGAAVAAFFGAFFGCLATLLLGVFGFVPEIASALVTTLLGGQLLIAHSTILWTREIVPAVYGGAFGGMTSVLWLSGTGSDHPVVLISALFILLSVVCGLAFSAVAVFDNHSSRRLAFGYGGRSGAIATVACVFFVEVASLCGADDGLFRAAGADLADGNPGSFAPIIAACLAGTVVTLLVLRRERVAAAGLAEKTFVASMIALIGLILVHLISPTDAGLLDAYYAGCFLGMSSRERLNGWVQAVLGAVVLASLIVQVRIFFNGIGGGLGLAAFFTVAVLVTFKQFTRGVLPLNRSENMAIRESSIRSRAGYSVANLQSEGRRRSTRSGISWRPAAAIVSLAVAAAVFGGAIWTAQFAPKKAISVATAPVSVADGVTPDPAAPQAEVRTGAMDAGTLPGTAGAAKVNPGATAPIQNISSESRPEQGSASTAGPRLASAAVADKDTGTEGPKAAPPVAPELVAVREPALGEIRKGDNGAVRDNLFREFLQWQAGRVSRVTPSTRQNAAKHHHRLQASAALPTLAATNPEPRSTQPPSAAQTTASSIARPRRPLLSNTRTHATVGQVAPASATASTPSF